MNSDTPDALRDPLDSRRGKLQQRFRSVLWARECLLLADFCQSVHIISLLPHPAKLHQRKVNTTVVLSVQVQI